MIKEYDVVIIGGSIGGVLASFSSLKSNLKVALVEETKWIGGQLTNQAVPSDEHRWIEEFGCTKTYRAFRNSVRDYYRNHQYFKKDIADNSFFNPGAGWVSRIAHEPKVSLKIFYDMLQPFIDSNQLDLFLETKAIKAEVENDFVKSVTCFKQSTQEEITFVAKFFVDGTDIGSLLPLTKTLYVTGAESKLETNEPHAPLEASPFDMQPVTWVAAIEFAKGENHTIAKPKYYEHFKNSVLSFGEVAIKKLSWSYPGLKRGETESGSMFGKNGISLFTYRRIINSAYYLDNYHPNDVTILNWPQNDYIYGNIYESAEADTHLMMAKELTLAVIYWLQTEAPRDDGGFGYPEIKPRGDITGTPDGLAMAPYIRESRRIKALHTILEQDISAKTTTSLPTFWDSVGIGSYHIDMHMTTVTKTFFYDNSWPFEIPLGILIPVKTKNLLPASKNIGTTHLTNGCFRLHPVEWNIGEVVGYLIGYCLEHQISPQELYANKGLVKAFQTKLIQAGIELHWPSDKVHII